MDKGAWQAIVHNMTEQLIAYTEQEEWGREEEQEEKARGL